jgi:epoxyqueuosine reductase
MQDLTLQIKELAYRTGFHKVGVTAAQQPNKSEMLSRWLGMNYHGTMKWMQDYADKRQDIQKLMPGARSVICVAHNYFTQEKHSQNPSHGKISRYAWGKDYHKVMNKKLKALLLEIKKLDSHIHGRLCVDTAPVMDKLWAEQAGIGWQGKHSNVITREYGSWVFLGEIIIDKELEYDQPAQDMCGSCSLCIQACPTGAIIQPYVIDATRCISYLTIEFWDKPIPDSLASKMDNWIFGCDICQDVCPWNRFQKETDEQAYSPRHDMITPDLATLVKMDEIEYRRKFKNSPVFRPKWKNFIRNITTVLSGQST